MPARIGVTHDRLLLRLWSRPAAARRLVAGVDEACVTVENPRQASAQLVVLAAAQREPDDERRRAAEPRQRVVFERDNGAIAGELEELDAALARVGRIVYLDRVTVEAEVDVLGVGRLAALEEEVARLVELGVGETDAPDILVLLD